MRGVKVYVGPSKISSLEIAAEAGGGVLVELADAEAIIYFGSDEPNELAALLHPGIRWVQLPHAGVEPWQRAGLISGDRVFTCSSGAYGDAVAEHALALMLAASRSLHTHARATTWGPKNTRTFAGSTIALIGAGGIGKSLMRLLAPFNVRVHAVSRSSVVGAETTVPHDAYRSLLPMADYVVLAAPATKQTLHLISEPELAIMKNDAWLINVGRGPLVDTDALLTALKLQQIGGAALDVTDPEPLPDRHGLWTLPNVLITPHCANPESAYWAGLNERTTENVEAYSRSGPSSLIGTVRPDRGY